MTLRAFTLIVSMLLVTSLAACAANDSEGGADASADTSLGADTSTIDTPSADTEGAFGLTIHANVITGSVPLTVEFSATVTGVPEEEIIYLWDFDNDSISDLAAPTIVYTTPGNYQVKCTARHAPTDETVTDELVVQVFTSPEIYLGVVDITSPTELAPGDAIIVDIEVFNGGGKVETPFTLEAYLSKDELLDGSDTTVFTTTIETMASGIYGDELEYFPMTSMIIPDTVEDGIYFFIVKADAGEDIKEMDETNNQITASSFITIDHTANYKPDLVIADFSIFATGELAPGDFLNFQLNIRNDGKSEAKNFRYAVYLSTDTELDEDDLQITEDDSSIIYSLEPEEFRSITRGYAIPDLADGQYYLLAMVDAQDTVLESDEDNNLVLCQQKLLIKDQEKAGFDLASGLLEVKPTVTYFGGSVQVSLIVENPGTLPTPSWSAAIYFSEQPALNPNTDYLMQMYDGDPIMPKDQVEMTAIVKVDKSKIFDLGDFYVSVYLDKDGEIDELEEGNNVTMFPQPVTVTDSASVDIEVGDVSFHPASVKAGEEVKVSYSLTNNGSSNSSAFYNAVVFSTQSPINPSTALVVKKIPIADVLPGDSVNLVEKVVVPIALPHETTSYYIGLIADVDNDLAGELSENNNSAISFEKLTVIGPMGGCFEDDMEPNNLFDQAIPIEPGVIEGLGLCGGDDWYQVSVPKGKSLEVSILLESPLYLQPQAYDLDLELYGGDGTLVLQSTMSGVYDKITLLASPYADDYHIRVLPKYPGNEAHYVLTTDLKDPAEGIDLLVDHIFVQPLTVYPGGLLTSTVVVYNLGDEASGGFNVSLYLSDDATIDPDDVALATASVPNILASDKYEIEEKLIVPEDMAGGTYMLLAQLDPEDAVDETDETNNVGISDQIDIDPSLSCESDLLEPNDSVYLATELLPITSSYGNLWVCPGLEDWYAIDLPEGVSFKVTTTYGYEQGEGLLGLQLYDMSKQSILDFDNTPSSSVVGIPYVFTAGRYYIRVRLVAEQGNETPYSYSMGVTVALPLESDVCDADVYESNNAFQTAVQIGCGLHSATLCKQDLDYYLLELMAGNTLSVTLDHPEDGVKASLVSVPGEMPVKVLSKSGTMTFAATFDQLIYLAVESSGKPYESFDYTVFIDGVEGVDLMVEDVGAFPDQIYQGESSIVSAGLTNTCIGDADTFGYTIYLSKDDRLDPTDSPLKSGTVSGGVPAKETVPLDEKVLVPASTLAGDYYLIVHADSGDEILESNELNNEGVAPVTILPVCQDDDYELNDTPDTASDLTMGDYEGLVLCTGDYDWFRVNLSNTDHIRILALFDADAADLDIRLYNELAPTSPLVVGSETSTGEEISFQVPQTGYYLIRVNGFAGAQGSYDLSLELL